MRKTAHSVSGGGFDAVARPEESMDQRVGGRARSPLPHLPTVLVLLVTLAMTATLSLVLRDVAKGQEKALLSQRVSEVVLLLQASITPITGSLSGAGAVASDQGDSPLFESIAAPMTANGGQFFVAKRRGDTFAQIAASGEAAPASGQAFSASEEKVLGRALTSPGMVSGLVGEGESKHLILALAVVGAEQTVAFLSSPIGPQTSESKPDPNTPYRDLDLVVYAGSEIDPASLLLASGESPGAEGEVATQEVPVGVDTWLVVASAREPLGGRLAVRAPWLAGAAGLLLALVLAIGVELVMRRRAYALRLVEERTASFREAQQSAERANRAKSEFLSRMSHELRTPLNSVLGFAQLLALDDLTEEQSDSVLQISRGGRHLLDLINEILDISRIETGTVSISLEPVLVEDVVADVASLGRPIADERGVSLVVDTGAAGEAYISADRRRVKQILLNLMGNAIKYNHEGGSVFLSCTAPEEGMLRIMVSDTGPGIPEEKFGLLFEPFERLGAEATSVEGAGIGLALSRGLAEAMGSTIGFTSKVGEGSTFWLEIPVAPGPVELTLDDDDEAVAPDPDIERRTVLCVEDNPMNLKLVERVLSRRPHIRLVTTPNGEPVVELAQQTNAALILLDLNLGDMSGSDVLHALREDAATAEIPVVVVSADATPTRVKRLMDEGASAYLTKPIDVTELLAVVDEMLLGTSPEVV
jgi:signal transduction histidine kinase/ActR/RegA family two-component response regulator